jgi:hypothetical protein
MEDKTLAWVCIYKENGVWRYKAFKCFELLELLGAFGMVTNGATLFLILKVPRYLATVVGIGIIRSIAAYGASFQSLFVPYPNPETVLRDVFSTARGEVMVLCPVYVNWEYGVLCPARRWDGCVGYVTHPDYIPVFAQVLLHK